MKKSVLFAINTMGGAGAERALINLFSAFSPDEYDIDLVVITGLGELIDEIPSYVNIIGEVRPVAVLSEEGRKALAKLCIKKFFCRANGIRLYPYMLSNYMDMKRIKRVQPDKLLWRLLSDGAPGTAKRYDLAVAFIEGGATYYVADHVRADRKVAFVHVDYRMAGYTRTLDRGVYDCFDKVFTVSPEIMESFIKVHPSVKRRMGVFENNIDQEAIRRAAGAGSGFKDDFDGIRLLTVGRITAQKAYEVSVGAMKELKRRGVNARWYVLGDGILRDEIASIIKQEGLEDDFILLGASTNPYPFMKECDIYVHASRFEGKSIAISEAKTLGCAIVASDVPGNRDQIRDGENGLLCSLTPVDIAEKVSLLINDKKLAKRLGENAAKEVIGKTDPEILF